MFVKNSFEYDARVAKEARSLSRAGHRVTVVALLAAGITPEREVTVDGYEVVRVKPGTLGAVSLVGRLQRRARSALARAARASGRDIDDEELTRQAQIGPHVTASPGDNVDARDAQSGSEATRSGHRWARLKMRALPIAAGAVRLVLRLGLRLFEAPLRVAKNLIENRRMRRVGERLGADVFPAHDRNTLWVALRCARRSPSARVVYDSHEYAAGRTRVGRVHDAWAAFTERRWLRRVDGLIVVSPVWLRMLSDSYGALPDPAVTVVNAPPSAAPEARDVHTPVGLPAYLPLLVYQGTIQEHRGLEAAIAAMPRLGDMGLVIIGWGHHRPEIERLIDERDVRDRVGIFGPIPHGELLDYTAGADIGLCNIVGQSVSYRTTLPNKLFEYFMAGVPVVGSTGTEIERVIAETGAGIAVVADDPDAVADAVTAIRDDYDAYARRARDAALIYNWELEEKKLIELYETVGGR